MELVTKITAPNPGLFTGGGTNTYLIGREDLTLVDPGPNIPEHIDEIIRQADGKIKKDISNTYSYGSFSSCVAFIKNS